LENPDSPEIAGKFYSLQSTLLDIFFVRLETVNYMPGRGEERREEGG